MLQIHETDPMSFVNAWEKNSSEYWDWFVNVEMFKSANSFPTINDYIAKICYIYNIGNNRSDKFWKMYSSHICILFPTHCYNVPVKLFICSIRK